MKEELNAKAQRHSGGFARNRASGFEAREAEVNAKTQRRKDAEWTCSAPWIDWNTSLCAFASSRLCVGFPLFAGSCKKLWCLRLRRLESHFLVQTATHLTQEQRKDKKIRNLRRLSEPMHSPDFILIVFIPLCVFAPLRLCVYSLSLVVRWGLT